MTAAGRFWLALTLTLSAAGSMALEIVAGRLLAPYVGMSLYSWTAIIAVVLAGLSAGHWLGGVLADRAARPGRAAGLALMAGSVTALASLFVLRAAAGPVLGAFDPISGIGMLALCAFFLPSFAIGVVSPLLTQMAIDAAEPDRRGRVLGRMFALGALGAILGTVGAGFWLLGHLGAHGAVLLVAVGYAALAVPFFGPLGRVAAAGAAALIVLAAAVGPGRVAALTTPCDVESDYYCIRVDPLVMDGRHSGVMVLDHLAHGVNDRADPAYLHSPYLRLADRLARRRFGGAPEAFFIGGGAYTLPRAWAAAGEGRQVVAEIDPAVTRTAAERLWLDPAPIEIHHRDARRVLEELPADRRFGVIFGDAFHDVSIPAHLVTDEFNALVSRRLAPGGFYMVNVIEALRAPRFLLAFAATLSRRFASVELWLDRDSLGPEEARVTWLVVATDRDSGLAEVRGPAGAWVRVPTAAMLATDPRSAGVVLTDDFAPVDRLMSHVLLDRSLAEQ